MSQILTKNGTKYFSSPYLSLKHKNYTIIGTQKLPSGEFIHTLKNDKGEYKDFDHDSLVAFVQQNETNP